MRASQTHDGRLFPPHLIVGIFNIPSKNFCPETVSPWHHRAGHQKVSDRPDRPGALGYPPLGRRFDIQRASLFEEKGYLSETCRYLYNPNMPFGPIRCVQNITRLSFFTGATTRRSAVSRSRNPGTSCFLMILALAFTIL